MIIHKEDVPYIHACFRCGEIMGEVELNDAVAIQKCSACGEHGVVSVQQALDILNQETEHKSEVGYELPYVETSL